ncbi:MAG: LamB/YcsF family protein, partial [Candidatus Puniceispirillaceae bacterium]
MTRFNLNADMAEGFGDWQMGNDDGLLGIINTANIACGFHAGDYNIMGDVMTKAAASAVSVGAHPGFYDLHGFGRRKLHLSEAEIERLIAYQLGATIAIGQLSGIAVTHIKPHGAINNMACADRALADAIVRGTSAVDQNIILHGRNCGPLGWIK